MHNGTTKIDGMNDRENAVLFLFVEREQKIVTPEDVAGILYRDRERPTNWRNGTLVFIRNLALKCRGYGVAEINRVSRLGAGGVAAYTLTHFNPAAKIVKIR